MMEGEHTLLGVPSETHTHKEKDESNNNNNNKNSSITTIIIIIIIIPFASLHIARLQRITALVQNSPPLTQSSPKTKQCASFIDR
jgi:hypothetical protein